MDDLLENSDDPSGETIWSCIRELVEGQGGVHPVSLISVMRDDERILLLPGDIRLSEFEMELGEYWNLCFQRRTRGMRGMSALSSLVNSLCEDYGIDYVLYDSGPNIGPLNRAILLDVDYFIVPAACDLLSIRAFKTLGRTLADWIQQWRTVRDLAPDEMYLLPGKPRFLGYIAQRFRVYGGALTTSHSKYLAVMSRRVDEDIARVLKRVSPDLVVESTMSRRKLGLVKDFGTLATDSETIGVSISMLSKGDAGQRREARKAFTDIARKIIQRATLSVDHA